ncbi:unnamed protein product [Mytilus edulis]|uniref:DDE Tnp4 domain-containing protein n=1 Tax=Mytilus edulis TaxID=6550 RepID=A0A8S3PWX4_MYTED|nr:unnamed protein product [Mytilus edulis]
MEEVPDFDIGWGEKLIEMDSYSEEYLLGWLLKDDLQNTELHIALENPGLAPQPQHAQSRIPLTKKQHRNDLKLTRTATDLMPMTMAVQNKPASVDEEGNCHTIFLPFSNEVTVETTKNPTSSETMFKMPLHHEYINPIPYHPTFCDRAFHFISNLWCGNVSDRYITEHSGFLDNIKAGDGVMADRGFLIRDLLLERKATLNIPPFTKKCVLNPLAAEFFSCFVAPKAS